MNYFAFLENDWLYVLIKLFLVDTLRYETIYHTHFASNKFERKANNSIIISVLIFF